MFIVSDLSYLGSYDVLSAMSEWEWILAEDSGGSASPVLALECAGSAQLRVCHFRALFIISRDFGHSCFLFFCNLANSWELSSKLLTVGVALAVATTYSWLQMTNIVRSEQAVQKCKFSHFESVWNGRNVRLFC